MIARALAIGLALALTGCIGGGGGIEAIYQLEALDAPQPPGGSSSAQILVPEPRALRALATDKIAVKPTPLTLSYYPSVVYQDAAPKVLQYVLLNTFQNSGRVRAVGLPGESLLINYQVVTEIRAFQIETFAGDRARVEVAAKLLNDANGRVIANQVFSAAVPIAGDGPDAAAEGMNRAAQALALEVVGWTLRQIGSRGGV